MTDTDSTYEALKEKYHLPSYDELNWEYEIGNIEEDDLVIRNVRKKVAEKFEYIANVLSSIIQPETDMTTLHEVSFFEDKEKEEIVKIYKRIMYYYRYASRLTVDDSEEANAAYINEAHAELKKLKPQLVKIFDKIKDAWTKEMNQKVEAGYFG